MSISQQDLESDLAALASLPKDTLSSLIDPSAPRSKPLGSASTLLAASKSNPTPETSVELSRAYVAEMHERTEQLKGEDVSHGGAVSDLQRLEKIRDTAEEVLAAVDDYAGKFEASKAKA